MFATAEMLKQIPKAFGSIGDLLASTAVGVPLTVSGTTANLVRGEDGLLDGSFGKVSAADFALLAAGIAGIAIGATVSVPNSTVPSGWSTLRRGPAVWAPPAGELIAAAVPSSDSAPVALVTPGVTTLVQIRAIGIIPDYMVPNRLEMWVSGNLGVMNASGIAGSLVGIGLSGNVPSGTAEYQYPIASMRTPNDSFQGIGSSIAARLVTRRGGFFKHCDAAFSSSYDQNTCGPFVSGNTKLYAMAKPSSVADQIRFDGAMVVSKGNL